MQLYRSNVQDNYVMIYKSKRVVEVNNGMS